MRRWATMSVGVFLSACSAHLGTSGTAEADLESGSAAGALDAPSYRLEWDGRQIGLERLQIDRAKGHDRWVGHVTQTEPLASDLRWEVWLDPREGAPAGFEVRLAIAGGTLRTQGWRDGADLRFERRGLGATTTGRVDDAAGAAVDLASPLSWWWAGRGLVESLAPGEVAAVRTVSVRPPSLSPEARVVRFSRTEDGALRVEGPGDETTRLVVDADGWPNRIVTDRPGWARSLIRRRVNPAAADR